MKAVLLQEIAKTSAEIQKKQENLPKPFVEQQEEMIFDLILDINGLADTMQEEGTEAFAQDMEQIRQDGRLGFGFLPFIYDIYLDTDKDLIATEEITMVTYFAYTLTWYDALRFLICQEGLFSILRGESQKTTEHRIFALLPPTTADAYIDYVTQKIQDGDL